MKPIPHTPSRLGLSVIAVLQVLSLGACGGNLTNPTPLQQPDFPLVSDEGCGGFGTGVTDTGLYMILGLGAHVLDPNASPLQATMRVGESVVIDLTAYGCQIDDPSKTSFISTNPAVAIVVPELPDGYPSTNRDYAQLKALAPGDTMMFADFSVETRPGETRNFRTTLAYCGPYDTLGCPAPRKTGVIRVVSQ